MLKVIKTTNVQNYELSILIHSIFTFYLWLTNELIQWNTWKFTKMKLVCHRNNCRVTKQTQLLFSVRRRRGISRRPPSRRYLVQSPPWTWPRWRRSPRFRYACHHPRHPPPSPWMWPLRCPSTPPRSHRRPSRPASPSRRITVSGCWRMREHLSVCLLLLLNGIKKQLHKFCFWTSFETAAEEFQSKLKGNEAKGNCLFDYNIECFANCTIL